MPSYEVAIIRTNEDGTREAVVFVDTPEHTVPIARATGLSMVGLLWDFLKTTRRKDAPASFQSVELDDTTRSWASAQFT